MIHCRTGLVCIAVACTLQPFNCVVLHAAESLITPEMNRPLEAHDIGWRWSAHPHVGVGISTVGSYHRGDGIPWGISTLTGIRTLIGPDSEHRFGLETSWLSTGLNYGEGLRDAVLIGPVAEMRIWRVAYLDVGILYAQEIGGERRGYADVMYSFGFAPSLFGARSKWTPSISYRGDLILATNPVTVRSLMLGLLYTF